LSQKQTNKQFKHNLLDNALLALWIPASLDEIFGFAKCNIVSGLARKLCCIWEPIGTPVSKLDLGSAIANFGIPAIAKGIGDSIGDHIDQGVNGGINCIFSTW